MTKAETQRNRVQNSTAFTILGYDRKRICKKQYETMTRYYFDDGSELTVVKSESGPFDETGSVFRFEVR